MSFMGHLPISLLKNYCQISEDEFRYVLVIRLGGSRFSIIYFSLMQRNFRISLVSYPIVIVAPHPRGVYMTKRLQEEKINMIGL